MERERRDIFFTLRLAYVELAVEAASSLVLFYDPVALAATLETQSVRRWLAELGYPETGAAEACDAELVILGTSTWGCGEAQDDWAAVGLPLMEAVNGTPRNARKGAFRGGVSFLDGVGGGPATVAGSPVAGAVATFARPEQAAACERGEREGRQGDGE